MKMRKEELEKIYEEVVNDIKNGYYDWRGEEEIDFEDLDILRKGTRMYKDLRPIPKDRRPYFKSPAKIYVENTDTFLKAIDLGEDCAVLNMASHKHPGGGVANGSRAQEEELCRRSNLLYSLYSFTAQGNMFGFLQHGGDEYPLPRYGGIFSPQVTIYREPGTYNTMCNPKKCSVISVAGIVRPELDDLGMINLRDVSILKGKIRTILRIAIIESKTKLVLGALGCGAFKNPPRHVAMIFKEILGEEEFSHSFEEICFAILEDSNSLRPGNPEGNLKPFMDVFGGR